MLCLLLFLYSIHMFKYFHLHNLQRRYLSCITLTAFIFSFHLPVQTSPIFFRFLRLTCSMLATNAATYRHFSNYSHHTQFESWHFIYCLPLLRVSVHFGAVRPQSGRKYPKDGHRSISDAHLHKRGCTFTIQCIYISVDWTDTKVGFDVDNLVSASKGCFNAERKTRELNQNDLFQSNYHNESNNI